MEARCRECGLQGTILLAAEGINGTVAGPREGIDAVWRYLTEQGLFSPLEWKESQTDRQPFYRMKVRIKKEIVTMGMPTVRIASAAGTHVAPQHWNHLIGGSDVTVLDVRNRYEVHLGQFAGAVDPGTDSFRDFPELMPSQRRNVA